MKDFLVAMKRTKWERDLEKYGSESALRNIYEIQNFAFDRVYESHERQKEALARLRSALQNADFAARGQLRDLDFSDYRCVVSFGGDNHFVYVSRFAKSPIVGINSDPKSSRGALLAGDCAQFLEFYARFNAACADGSVDRTEYLKNQATENWSRIECTITLPDGTEKSIGACTSEYSVRNRFAEYMSRYLLRKGSGEFKEEKCSGLLAATGAGSTGWFKNCLPESKRNDSVFPRDAPYFAYVAREALIPLGPEHVLAGETLEIISEMDGEIVADSDDDLSFSFPYGARARFFLSQEHLQVIHKL
ncbi:MAG: hypothetical protein K8S54_10800 [Spirochaetia bacterium]|nr:hypothetical protein [Spirochaetia bacterium]